MRNILDDKSQIKKKPWEKLLSFFKKEMPIPKTEQTELEIYEKVVDLKVNEIILRNAIEDLSSELQKIEYLEREELKKLKKQFAASPFSSVFGDISLQLRSFGEKHGWKAYSIYFLTLMSCLFHITSFNTLLIVYDSDMFLLFRWLIAIGLSMTLEFSFIFFKYKRNVSMTAILFITSFVILFYSAFYQVWMNKQYFIFDSYASSKDMIRFILGNSFFCGLLAFVHVVSPRKRGKKVTYSKLPRQLKQSLNELVDKASPEKTLDFKETSIGWNILESELRKLIIRKGKWNSDFVVNNTIKKGKKSNT